MSKLFVSFIFTFSIFQAFCYIQNYNDTFAHMQWDFAIISYCKQELIKNWTCGSDICGLHNVTDIQLTYEESYNVLGYVAYYPAINSIQVALRGTMPLSLTDWLKDDADMVLVAYPYCVGCEVETGFYASFQVMEAQLVQQVKAMRQKYPNAKINIVGHSLGASYAAVPFNIVIYVDQLMAASLNQMNIPIETIYTFGQPRVGNKALADWFDSIFPNNYARIVHHRDIIPHVPFENLGYVHMNTEVFYDYESTSYEICDATEDSKCSDKFPIELCDIVPGHSFYMGKSIMPFFVSCSNGVDFIQ